MTEWSRWSSCSSTCDIGVKRRHRTISVPSENGGNPCPKKLTLEKRCKERECDGGMFKAIEDEQFEAFSVYVRWGKADCPADVRTLSNGIAARYKYCSYSNKLLRLSFLALSQRVKAVATIVYVLHLYHPLARSITTKIKAVAFLLALSTIRPRRVCTSCVLSVERLFRVLSARFRVAE